MIFSGTYFLRFNKIYSFKDMCCKVKDNILSVTSFVTYIISMNINFVQRIQLYKNLYETKNDETAVFFVL